MKGFATILFVLILSLSSFSAPGDLDMTFGTGGKTQANFGAFGTQEANAIAIQADGKIVTGGVVGNGGTNDFALARFNVDGTLDTTFDTDGKVVTNFGGASTSFFDEIQDIAIQADGKIVAVGESRFAFGNIDLAVARYNTDGSLDTTFNSNGLVRAGFGATDDLGNEVVIQPDGKIVVAGSREFSGQAEFLVVRFNTDGSLDTGFDTDGWATRNITANFDRGQAIALQTNGKILVAGTYGNFLGTAVLRYNTNGTLDTTFDTDGIALIPSFLDRPDSLAIQTDGKYVIAGATSNTNLDFAVARMNTNGTLDSTFDTDGKVSTAIGSGNDIGKAVAIQADGKIFVAGYGSLTTNDFAVVRYNSDGSLDNAFWDNTNSIWGTGGIAAVDFSSGDDRGNAIALDAFQRVIVAGGNNTFKVTRSQNNIAPTAANANISGRVLTQKGRGISRATVHVTDQDGNIQTARTNPFGYYRFENIEVGQTLIFNVYNKRFQFQTQVVNLEDNISGLNFIADN